MHCKWPCLDAFPPLIADHNVTSKFLVMLLIRLSLLQTFPQYFPTGLHSAWTHGFFKILGRISKIGSDSLLWDRKLWSYEASFYRVTQTNTHRNRWQDWRCQGSFLRGKKSSLNHTPAWPHKFLFKTQRNEFEALGRKLLNAVQLISQDNSRRCIMFVWSLTHKAKKPVLFIFFFYRKDG